ncbi:MAG: helix-turn-helix domain-containing protein [Nitrospinaceae bacterium]|nr:helix-turn-helix transcriptional regulator [Nitrospinaceae bacterium]NIR57852.1 helix-turn-helix transcriptional regulator [Nitrospinaceae bacterium]NIS87280.1 helix-turn-helix transcriptional regulator [Nitrospinaceae bacterium]NIT84130.1 helix-turn-helix transcriptional regulator [Nitrospinaceae bacterium]NIU46321.1 helix-turn-helix transcriptional regulator [Nitrospinaceae bacterium]
MSVLAQNMKTIRRELKCTQSAMSDILKVGFRTYVRYEAGERDAPVGVLVKMARLGNISLETLLTTKIDPFSILVMDTDTLNLEPPDVKWVNFQTGNITFKKPHKEGILALSESEKKAVSAFRRMSPQQQSAFLKDLEKSYKASGASSKGARQTASRASYPNPIAMEQKAAAKKSSSKSPKKKGRPGRKKLDKKALKEKIDRLKMVTKTVPKITVR